MISETLLKSIEATMLGLKEIVKKYNIPEEEVFKLFSEVYAENMKYKKD